MDDSFPNKKVSPLLGAGIFFIPWLFSWFTLKDGYSNNARRISLIWMAIVVAIIYSSNVKKHDVVKQPVKLETWASNLPQKQLIGICLAGAMGEMRIIHHLENGESIDIRELVEKMPTLSNNVISAEYLPNSKLIWQIMFDDVLEHKERDIEMLRKNGDKDMQTALYASCGVIFGLTDKYGNLLK